MGLSSSDSRIAAMDSVLTMELVLIGLAFGAIFLLVLALLARADRRT
jgi:hypothetical protein